LKLAVTPEGRPEAENDTAAPVPPVSVAETGLPTDPLRATDRAPPLVRPKLNAAAFATVTAIAAEVVVLFEVSRATADSEWLPFAAVAVSQVTE
jgi:hypothetical protein